MKKLISLLLCGLLVLSLTACGGEDAQGNSNDDTLAASPEAGTVNGSENLAENAGNDGEDTREGANIMAEYDFSVFTNVELIGADLSEMSDDQLSVLYQQARYCQAMTEADTDTLREIVSEDAVFTHMSGRQQTREEYFADIENGSLRYFTIGIDSPVVEVDGDMASVTYTSVLNANAYGARGTYRMGGTHWFEKQDGSWISVNAPNR